MTAARSTASARPGRRTIAIIAAGALVLAAIGGVVGRALGEEDAPPLPPVEIQTLDRPEVGDTIVVPSAVDVPRRLPRG